MIYEIGLWRAEWPPPPPPTLANNIFCPLRRSASTFALRSSFHQIGCRRQDKSQSSAIGMRVFSTTRNKWTRRRASWRESEPCALDWRSWALRARGPMQMMDSPRPSRNRPLRWSDLSNCGRLRLVLTNKAKGAGSFAHYVSWRRRVWSCRSWCQLMRSFWLLVAVGAMRTNLIVI